MNYVDLEVAINNCLKRCGSAAEGRDAKEWALAAAVLIDKSFMPRPDLVAPE